MDEPPPGIYENVPFEDYLTWPYISNSRLAAAAKSMRHYDARIAIEETAQMRFGTLCHANHLDPDCVAKRYAVMPAFERMIRHSDGSEYVKPRATAAYRQLVEEFTEDNPEKIIITQKEFDDAAALVESLCSKPRAVEYLDGFGPVEVSIVWDDPVTGLRLKGRIDKWQPGVLVADLKTSRDVQGFSRQIALRGYHRQGAMYLDGLQALTGQQLQFCIVAVENTAPWDVRAAPVSAEAIQRGREEYRGYLAQILQCQETGDWPGYEDPETWDVPDFSPQDVTLTLEGELITL